MAAMDTNLSLGLDLDSAAAQQRYSSPQDLLHSDFSQIPAREQPSELDLLNMWEQLLQALDEESFMLRFNGKDLAESVYEDDKKRHDHNLEAFHGKTSSTAPHSSLRSAFWEMCVRSEDPDMLLSRFLIQQKGDARRALEKLLASVVWRVHGGCVFRLLAQGEEGIRRVATNPQITAEDREIAQGILAHFSRGLFYFHGHDKLNRPVGYLRWHLHYRNSGPFKSLSDYIIWSVETARLQVKPGIQGVTLVVDVSGTSMQSIDLWAQRWFIEIMKEYYPLGVGLILMHRAPRFFEGIWSIIRATMNSDTVKKIRFTRNADDLAMYIDRSHIPAELGGDDSDQYFYSAPNPGENEAMNNVERRNGLLRSRAALAVQYETCTRNLIMAVRSGAPDVEQVRQMRKGTSQALRDTFWELDPHIRARSFYERRSISFIWNSDREDDEDRDQDEEDEYLEDEASNRSIGESSQESECPSLSGSTEVGEA